MKSPPTHSARPRAPTGPCRPNKRDDCKCLPDAVLLSNDAGVFQIMPQLRRSTSPGKMVDSRLQVQCFQRHIVG